MNTRLILIIALIAVIAAGFYLGFQSTCDNACEKCGSIGGECTCDSMCASQACANQESPTPAKENVSKEPIAIVEDKNLNSLINKTNINQTPEGNPNPKDNITIIIQSPDNTKNDSPETESIFPDEPTEIRIFWQEGCLQCANQKVFLNKMSLIYPELKVTTLDIDGGDNLEDLKEICTKRGINCDITPLTIIGDLAFEGFYNGDGRLVGYVDENSYKGYEGVIYDVIATMFGSKEKSPPESFDGSWWDGANISLSINGVDFISHDPIYALFSIWSPKAAHGVRIMGNGVEGYFKVDDLVDLKAGQNYFVLEDMTPACFSCANFQPGEYTISLFVKDESEQIAKADFTIYIEDD